MTSRTFLRTFALLFLLLPIGCSTATDLLYEPASTDPLDGYKGSLANGGVNTEMDWGPKQNLLLSQFKTLNELKIKLENELSQKDAENQNLKAQLANDSSALQKERALRAQAEAETELLRQRRRELEARILSLSIEKAKLEQQNLLGKIEALQRQIEQGSMQQGPVPMEAAAVPPRNH
jgi:chromosome segregation ATPase